MSESRFRVGDVFTVPIDRERVAYGQLVDSWGNSGGHFYVALFASVYGRDERVELDDALSGSVKILALSMDALLFHGHWQVVGHGDVVRGLPWPAYKEGVSPPGTYEIVDHAGRLRRRATGAEVERLPFRSVVAPIRLEKAIQALHGLSEWNAAYDELRPVSRDLTSDHLFG